MPAKFIRKRNRLPFKELYQAGYWYFVTICVENKVEAFVEASLSRHDLDKNSNDKKFKLNEYGKEVEKA